MKQLNPIQLRILNDLLFEPNLRHADLKPYEMDNGQFAFHLNHLVAEKLVIKKANRYYLTDLGKEFANRGEKRIGKVGFQAKVTTVLCGVRALVAGNEYLIYTRTKNPFFGCQGFGTEKVPLGNRVVETAVRGLREEANLKITGEPTLFAIRHYRVFSESKKLLEDKLMFGFLFSEPEGELRSSSEGDFAWVKEHALKQVVSKPQEEFWDFYNALRKFNGNVTFGEVEVTTTNF